MPQFIHPPAEEYLGCFQFEAFTNKATLNIHVQVFDGYMHSFILINPRSRMAAFYSRCMFNFLRDDQAVFQVAVSFFIPIGV